MELVNITMKEFERAKKDIRSVIIPCGSVEEHGMHLPLGTDTMHAVEIARRTAKIRPVFVAAPLWYGLCRSTSEHPGTLTIKGTTLRALLLDIIESLYVQGVVNQIVISGHAGGTHMSFLVDAAEEAIYRLPNLKCAVLSIIDLVKEAASTVVETPGDSHAGEVETSVIQAINPDMVRGTSPEEFPVFPKFLITRKKRLYWPGGVWGNPRKASPRKGESILDLEAKKLAEIIEELEKHEEI